MRQQDAQPEFSRPVAVDGIGEDGLDLSLEAEAGERRLLAERLDVEDVPALQAHAWLVRAEADRVRVHVDFSAEVLQSCVISLEPVTSRIRDRFVEVFAPGANPDEPEVIVDPVAEGPPEPIVDGQIDVGELVVQYLALAIDPYPRRADAADPSALPGPAAVDGSGEGEDATENPFAALAALRTAGGRGAKS